MTIAKSKPMTLEEYLCYDNGTDARRYELWNGILIDIGAESDINILIESFLIVLLSQFISYKQIRKGTELEVSGNLANARIPDLIVLTEAGLAALSGKRRSIITLDMPPPLIVVEVVSSSTTNKQSRDRDYVEKRREYAQRQIPEYWIVDPEAETVLILTLVGKEYKENAFSGSDLLLSPTFEELSLSASQLLNAEL